MQEQIPITLRVALDAPEAMRILVRFLKDYASDADRPRFVIGLSGGVDSAVSAALAVQAVGAENVHAMLLPDGTTPAKDLQDAENVARALDIRWRRISIQPMVDSFLQGLDVPDRAIAGNVKARCRMILLHADAARRQALVLGTGNKTEILVGYFSKYGDGGVDVQPLGDLYKTQVWQLARHLKLPEAVINKAPTAGLWAGQTDEAELGIAYERLDRLLLGLELKLPARTIANILQVSEAEVQRIQRMRRQTQHKRRMPMIPKIGLRTVGIDWREPTH